jgi:hypothetical protein
MSHTGRIREVGAMKPRQIVEFSSSERSTNKVAVFWLDGCRLYVEPAAVHNAASRLCDFLVKGCCYAIVPLETDSDGAARPLSRREREVARLIAKGPSAKMTGRKPLALSFSIIWCATTGS